jgi:N-acetylmuramic acid 6-phosphate etherase
VVKTNFATEQIHDRADELDALSTLDFLRVMNAADATVAAAVERALPVVAGLVEEVVRRLAAGGRLHYAGAGSSGLLADLDASECRGTFGIDAGVVVSHSVAGGSQEDDEALGRSALSEVAPGDVVVAISASGETPYALGALRAARDRGAYTVALVNNPDSSVAAAADTAVVLLTGAEVVAGSTRLKAGTAQKLVLNMLSTATFQRLGRLHRGRMVGVIPDNRKLWNRAVATVADLTSCDPGAAEAALSESGGDARLAIVMLALAVDSVEAGRRLAAAGGRLSSVLTGRNST